VHDQLSNGQSFRALTIIDIYSREALAIEVGQRLRGEHVVAVLNRLVEQRRTALAVCRQWRRIYWSTDGLVGVSSWGTDGLLAPG
jgi:hypothetical protein